MQFFEFGEIFLPLLSSSFSLSLSLPLSLCVYIHICIPHKILHVQVMKSNLLFLALIFCIVIISFPLFLFDKYVILLVSFIQSVRKENWQVETLRSSIYIYLFFNTIVLLINCIYESVSASLFSHFV